MTAPFYYRRATAALAHQLVATVSGRESLLLVGCHDAACEYLVRRVRDGLIEDHSCLVLSLDFHSAPDVRSATDLAAIISRTLTETGHTGGRLDGPPGDLASALDILTDGPAGHIVFVAANVDSLPDDVTRTLLGHIRVRVTAGALTVVLTGEHDLRDFVHGPNSEFNCANQFVIQGFDEDAFADCLTSQSDNKHRRADLTDSLITDISRHSGSNVYVAQSLIDYSVERRSRGVTPDVELSRDDIADRARIIQNSAFFREALRIIAYHPEVWKDLEIVCSVGRAAVAVADQFPTALESSGLIRRDGPDLSCRSSAIRSALSDFFDSRRLADLYARRGDWKEAFRRYALSSETVARPSSIEDRDVVDDLVRSLCSQLYLTAHNGTRSLRDTLAQGARFVLGFETVLFLRQDGNLLPEEGFGGREYPAQEFSSISSMIESAEPGIVELPEQLGTRARCLVVEDHALRTRIAVLLAASGAPISRKRSETCRELFTHFASAYRFASEASANRARLGQRDQQIQIIDTVFAALGSSGLDVAGVLKLLGASLRRLGYSHVLISLLDASRGRIRGVYSESDPSRLLPSELVNYDLGGPDVDVQPYVVKTKMPLVIADATVHPLVNPALVQHSSLRSFAVVPILTQEGEVLGTILVQRADDSVPSQADVEDLVAFGRQLAIILIHSERILLLQDALNRIPEPLVIADPSLRVRYANRPAAQLLDMEPGWFDAGSARSLGDAQDDALLEWFHGSLEGHRMIHRLNGLGSDHTYRGQLLTDAIPNWWGQVVGVVGHVQDQRFLYRVFGAIALVGSATDSAAARQALLDAAELLGFSRPRLFEFREGDPPQLVSSVSRGLGVGAERAFNSRTVVWKNTGSDVTPVWESIAQGRPIVFDLTEDGGSAAPVIHTEQGLEVRQILGSSIPSTLSKKPNVRWLSVPLITRDGLVLGVLVADCPFDLLPEQVEMLRILGDQVSQLLRAFETREQLVNERLRWTQSAIESSMSSVAHNLGSRLASLSPLLARYRRAEADAPNIAELNSSLELLTRSILQTVSRVRELLGTVVLRPQRFDVLEVLRRVLGTFLSDEQCSVSAKPDAVILNGDQHLFESAIVELIQNSLQAVPDRASLRIRVSVEEICDGVQERIRIVYADNGPGVRDEIKGRIFDEFFSFRPKGKPGTGLGLAFVRRVVAAHSGSVAELGRPNEGARFVIELPTEPTEAPHVN